MPTAHATNLFRSSRHVARLGVALIVVTVVTAIVTIWDLRSDAIVSYQTDQQQVAVSIAEQASQSLQAVDLVLHEIRTKILASAPQAQAALTEVMGDKKMQGFLSDRLVQLPQAQSLSIIDASGAIVNSSLVSVPPMNLAEREFFRHFIAEADTQLFIGTPVKALVSGAWTVYVALRLEAPNGAFLGVVTCALEIGYFEDFYRNVATGVSEVVTLLRRDGTIIARYPHVDSAVGKMIPMGAAWHDIVRDGGGAYRSPGYIVGEGPRVVSLRPLRDYPLVVSVLVSEGAALAHWRGQAIVIAIGAFCAIVGFAALFLLVAAQFRKLEQSRGSLRAAKEDAEAARVIADQANSAKSTFLTNISHDIRTPMHGIIGMADLLARTEMDERQTQYVSRLRNAASNLLVLINDLLDVSKLEAGRLTIETVDFDLGEVIGQTIELVMPSATEKGIRLDLAMGENAGGRYRGDPARIRQVLGNLIGNAVKFTERGSVSVIASVSHDIRIDIVDTGIGISPEQREGLFKKFSQADDSISRRFGGTGLGLAISRQLAAAMGGTIEVESCIGEGSTFSLILPLVVSPIDGEASPPLPSVPATPRSDRARRILLAEDLRTNQIIASDLLTGAGYVVDVVNNGEEAVAAVQRCRYDVILMDVRMPVLDGIAATRRIRSLGGAAAAIPVVALSADAVHGAREHYLASGMDDFLSKPFDPLALFSAVDRWISASAPSDANHATGDESVPLLDEKRIAEIESVISPTKFATLAQEWIATATAWVPELNHLVASGDFGQVCWKAHDLAGTAGNIGAERLSRLARKLDQAGADREAASARQLVREIAAVSTATFAALHHRCSVVLRYAAA